MLKQIMIPVAAFAVTVTGVSAFNPDMLEKIDVDLSDTQISALEEVHELRQTGANKEEVKEILEDAGVDQDTMHEIREAVHEVRDEMHTAVDEAIADNDYDAFVDVIAGTPLADAITSESDFASFVEAKELRDSGDHEGAAEIMADLGIEKQGGGKGHGGRGGAGMDGERPERGEGGERPERGGERGA